jgi:hypothetical protein
METEMKKIVFAAAALAVLVASPAFAQSYDPDIGSGNLDSWPYTSNPDRPYAAQVNPYSAYGFDPYYGTYVPAPRGTHRRERVVR